MVRNSGIMVLLRMSWAHGRGEDRIQTMYCFSAQLEAIDRQASPDKVSDAYDVSLTRRSGRASKD